MSDWEAELDEPTPKTETKVVADNDDWENELEDNTQKISTSKIFNDNN